MCGVVGTRQCVEVLFVSDRVSGAVVLLVSNRVSGAVVLLVSDR